MSYLEQFGPEQQAMILTYAEERVREGSPRPAAEIAESIAEMAWEQSNCSDGFEYQGGDC